MWKLRDQSQFLTFARRVCSAQGCRLLYPMTISGYFFLSTTTPIDSVLTMEQFKHSVFLKFSAVTLSVAILCTFVMCQASLQNKSAVFEIGDIVVSWGDQIVTKISEKMNALTDFDAIRQIIDATIEEDCYIEDCPSGAARQPNPDFIPESNGCGSFGVQWKKELLPDEGLEDCCNSHDYCYDVCGADRDICDLEFKTCLYSVCRSRKDQWTVNELKACKVAAKLMYTATQAFGCKAYQDAQKKSCHCVAMIDHQEF